MDPIVVLLNDRGHTKSAKRAFGSAGAVRNAENVSNMNKNERWRPVPSDSSTILPPFWVAGGLVVTKLVKP